MADVPELLERALDHYAEGRIRKAERVLDRVEARDPENAEAMYLRGIIAFGRTEFEAALGFFEAAVAADASVARFQGTRAMTLGIAGRMEDAREAYWAAIRLKPDEADYWSGLGAALDRLGETEAALAADESNADLHNLLCAIYEAREEYGLAEASARRSIELDPEQTDSMGVLARVLRRSGREDEAAGYEGRIEALRAADG